MADKYALMDKIERARAKIGELDQRPRMKLAEPLLVEMLKSAIVQGYVSGSVGAGESEDFGDWVFEVEYSIHRKSLEAKEEK
jgi:hypothetical protein